MIYVTAKVENNEFAIPVEHILYVLSGEQSMPCAILPNGPKNIKCMMEVGGDVITVACMPGTSGNILLEDSFIVVLKAFDQNLGIIVNEAHLITIPENEIQEDQMTGSKSFIHDGKTYFLLDIWRLYNDLGIQGE